MFLCSRIYDVNVSSLFSLREHKDSLTRMGRVMISHIIVGYFLQSVSLSPENTLAGRKMFVGSKVCPLGLDMPLAWSRLVRESVARDMTSYFSL